MDTSPLAGARASPPTLSADIVRRNMATAPVESTPQRLAAVRDQLKLLADYL